MMLHDMIVAMGIYAKRSCLPESPLHDTIKDSMHLRPTRQAMDDIVRFVVQPCAIVDFLVCRFRSRQESKICYNPLVICNHKPSFTSDVRLDNLLRWITVDPLVHVTRSVHHLPCRIYYRHDSRNVLVCRKSDCHAYLNSLLICLSVACGRMVCKCWVIN